MKLHLVLFPLCFLFLSFLHGADRKMTIIHKQGQFNCHTFRIPAMATTNKGTLLAVYDLRYKSRRDLQGHMDIGLSRSTDGGETWARPISHYGHEEIWRSARRSEWVFGSEYFNRSYDRRDFRFGCLDTRETEYPPVAGEGVGTGSFDS